MALYGDVIKQMSDVGIDGVMKQLQGLQVQPTSGNVAALSNTSSPYKFKDWANAKGYEYSYNPQTNQYKLNDVELPEQVTSALSGEYGTEQVYENILGSYQDLLKTQQQNLEQAQAPQTTAGAESDVETGEYVSPYQGQIDQMMQEFKNITPYATPEELNQYLQQLLQSSAQPFTYDPTKDQALKTAQKEAGRQVREAAGAKGTLYSSGTISKVAGAQGALIPQHEMKAYQRFSDQKNREMNMFTTLLKWDEMQANRYMDQIELAKTKFDYLLNLDAQEFEKFQLMLEQRNYDREYQLQQQSLQLERNIKEINDAYKRVDALGFVDNHTAIVLGLPVGTKAQWVKALELEQKQEMDRMQKEFDNNVKLQKSQAQIEKDLIKYKNTLDEAQKKKLMAQQYAYDKKLADYQQNLKTGKSNPSVVNGVIASAKSLMGLKYVWGGTSATKGMDCSGFTQWAFKQQGITIPKAGRYQATSGKYVPKNQLQPGDLVFFNTYMTNGHVGIYTGNGQFIHTTNNGKGVQMDTLARWGNKYSTGRRITGSGVISYDRNVNNYAPGGKSSLTSSSGKYAYSSKYKAGSVGKNTSPVSTATLQRLLNQQGFGPLTVDGAYGPLTTKAVANMQKKYGIQSDGWFGPISYKYLKAREPKYALGGSAPR